LHVVLEGPSRPPLILTIFGETLEGLSYEEQSIATLLHTILSTREVEKLSHPGITLEKGSFERLVEKYVEEGAQVFYLDKEGADIRQTSFADNPVFLFGDYIGMPAKTEKLLERKGVAQLTLGPTML
jgi:tRNA pseudouridine-54 N-methylase